MASVGFLAPAEPERRRLPRRAAVVVALMAGMLAAAALGGPGVVVPKPGARRFPKARGTLQKN